MILPIFVDVVKIKSAPIEIDLHKKYSSWNFIILMASRLTKEKNISLAIDAFKSIAGRYPRTLLLIVGSGPEEKRLKRQTRKLELGTNVIFEKQTTDLISYLKSCDLFLLTSKYEGYGRTLVEGAAAGTRVISSDVGIASELLPESNIFNVGNKKDLERKLENAIKGEIGSVKTLGIITTKQQYLSEYKRFLESCMS
jgi:glycosyltransferase involved in cell wall biosynthesis